MDSKTTIVATARQSDWEQAKKTGEYTQSTIDSTLEEVGFIHCSFADQVMDMVNRKYADQDDLVLLLINPDKVASEVKYERALSGRAGVFPHIYGPLNTDSVLSVLKLTKANGQFVSPETLRTMK